MYRKIFTDQERDKVIYEIQEVEAAWLANQCIKNLGKGIDIIFAFNRVPHKYSKMSDDRLLTIRQSIDSNENFDFLECLDLI